MKDAKMKQLMDLAEQLDKYVSNGVVPVFIARLGYGNW